MSSIFLRMQKLPWKQTRDLLLRTILYKLREIGFTRLSLGMQSADPGELKLLNRQHDFRPG